MTLRRGDFVTYAVPDVPGTRVESLVKTVHHNGEVTIQARFILNADGTRRPGFLGYTYRVESALLELSRKKDKGT